MTPQNDQVEICSTLVRHCARRGSPRVPPTAGAAGTARSSGHLLTQAEAAAYLSVSPRTLEGLRFKGGGPAYVKLSHRCVRYRWQDLQDWVAERVTTNTSAAVQ